MRGEPFICVSVHKEITLIYARAMCVNTRKPVRNSVRSLLC